MPSTKAGFARASIVVAMAMLFARQLAATEVDVRVVDGLGRPIEGVTYTLRLLREDSVSTNGIQRIDLFRGTSDADGRIRGAYDETLQLPSDSDWAELAKDGYSGYSDSEPKSEYVLRAETRVSFAELAALPHDLRVDALRELLASEAEERGNEDDDAALKEAGALRPALRALVEDAIVGRSAIMLLADIGDSGDIEYIVAHAPEIAPDDDDYDYWENRWAYMVATSAVNPDSDAVWAFLESAASGDFHDGWVDAGAAMALWLSDPVRALPALQHAAERNADRRDWLLDLAARIGTVPAQALAADDPGAAAAALGPVLEVGRFTGAAAPRVSPEGDLARIDLGYRNGRDALVYTASYRRDALGVWRLRGVRETRQALLAE